MEVTRIPKKTVILMEPKNALLVDKTKHHQKRVAAYCRVSTDSEEQLTSYTNQKKFYTEMISEKKEWTLAGLYADEGISGTRADKRPEFQRMIKDCMAGKIDYIVTKSVSRFARNTVDCIDHVRILRAKGIGVYFEEQNIDTLQIDSELYLVIYAGFAQSESENISKNIIWTIRNNFADGKVIFQYKRFLGYRKGVDGKPEIVPEEAAVVERIYNMYLAGETPQRISQVLKAEGISFPNKTINFSPEQITNILTNEKYCGDAVLQKTVTIDCIAKIRQKNMGEAPMYYVQNSHPAIVSRELFNRVQEEVARRRTRTPQSSKTAITATGKYSRYALTDVMVCAECGSKYRRVTWTAKGQKRIVWRCVNRLDHGKRYCKHSPTVKEQAIQKAVMRAVRRFNEEDATTYLALMKATIADAIGMNGSNDEIQLLEMKITALNRKMMELVNDSITNGGSIEGYEGQIKEMSDSIDMFQRRIKVIEKQSFTDHEREERMSRIQQIISEREAKDMEYDDSIVHQMIECVRVYPNGKLEIIFGGGYTVEEVIDEDD